METVTSIRLASKEFRTCDTVVTAMKGAATHTDVKQQLLLMRMTSREAADRAGSALSTVGMQAELDL
jgi:hypothetical protein